MNLLRNMRSKNTVYDLTPRLPGAFELRRI